MLKCAHDLQKVTMVYNLTNFETGTSIFGVIHLILFLIVIFEILQSDRTIVKKLAWGALVFLFPILGLIIYFLFSAREEHDRRYHLLD